MLQHSCKQYWHNFPFADFIKFLFFLGQNRMQKGRGVNCSMQCSMLLRCIKLRCAAAIYSNHGKASILHCSVLPCYEFKRLGRGGWGGWGGSCLERVTESGQSDLQCSNVQQCTGCW